MYQTAVGAWKANTSLHNENEGWSMSLPPEPCLWDADSQHMSNIITTTKVTNVSVFIGGTSTGTMMDLI